MLLKRYFPVFIFCIFFSSQVLAQYDAPLYTSYTTPAARAKLLEQSIKYSIDQNLSIPLTDSTEENWEDAFGTIEVLFYRSASSDKKVRDAFEGIQLRSTTFQKALLELVYTNYPGMFFQQVKDLLYQTSEQKVFAMSAEYLLQQKNDSLLPKTILGLMDTKFAELVITDPILYMLHAHISENSNGAFLSKKLLKELFSNKFLPGQTVMYSIQRKNRDYPGVVIIRQKNGYFVTDSSGTIFNVPQLARSITNLPGYITNGNTPQGIFLMHGFDVSMSSFIGPTPNVQLSMPVETNIQHFLYDSTIADTVWNIDYYKKLLPPDLKSYLPLYYSYYSGLAGRTEIIAHGTAIDPNFYAGRPYFPLTPTEGCLCTKEIWNGKRIASDQLKLINALLKAGGATGYCVVIELDDKQSAVTLEDVLPFLATIDH